MIPELVLRARTEYGDLGYDTLPLAPGTKVPINRDWQNRSPAELWRNAPDDANIGIRCGGNLRLAVFDADDKNDPQTSQNVFRYLAGLGFDVGDYPVIATPNNGRHFDTMMVGELPGNYRRFRSSFGAGEFRYGQGAFVGAPPSIVDGKAYRLIAGDLRTLPRIQVADVLPILRYQDTTSQRTSLKIPRNAKSLLKGENIDRYPSRSEAEQAIIASLVNAGHAFESVQSLFAAFPAAGKFKELYSKDPRNAVRWLRHSFNEALMWSSTHESPGRQYAGKAMEWALSRAWTGRTGAVDQATFIAHCQIAHRAGRVEYQASCRDLAELAQVSNITAARATHRLADAGWVVLTRPATALLSHVYRLGQLSTLPHSGVVGECTSLSITHHDAFRARGYGNTFRASGLGLSARQVYDELRREALTIKELAARTGRHPRTVRRALTRMMRVVDAETGDVLQMVEQVGGRWRICGDVDLDRVARALGTYGGGSWQHARDERERSEHRAWLSRE